MTSRFKKNFFEILAKEKVLDQNRVSFYLDRSPGSGESFVRFGSLGKALEANFGIIEFYPILKPAKYWEVSIDDILVDGESLGLCGSQARSKNPKKTDFGKNDFLSDSGSLQATSLNKEQEKHQTQLCTGIFDTGTSLIMGPAPSVTTLLKKLKVNKFCQNLSELPSIT